MAFTPEVLIYLIAAVAIIALFYVRQKGLEAFMPESVPELDKKTVLELRSLLQTSYERTLYLGVSFLFLAYATARASEIKAFAVLLTLGLFIYNIPPRHKAMRIINSSGLELGEMKKRGIRF